MASNFGTIGTLGILAYDSESIHGVSCCRVKGMRRVGSIADQVQFAGQELAEVFAGESGGKSGRDGPRPTFV
jgi:hypothetical protein